MAKRMIIMIIALFLVFGAIFGWNGLRSYFIKEFFATYQPPPVSVSTTIAKIQTWQPFIPTVGTLNAVNGVSISPEIAGKVVSINFKSGQVVVKGNLLVKIDDSVEQADLKNNQAELKLDALQFKRIADLYKTKAASKSQLDEAQAKFTQAKAAVDKTQAIIAQKYIKAPFAGKIGIREVNVGQYVSPGQKLVTLQSLASLFVNFSLPEQDFNKLYVGQSIKLKIDTYPSQTFSGKINAINAEVEVATRNILVQALIPNKDNKLVPGMFANIKILLPEQKNLITVPQTAISYSLFGDSIFVIEKKGKDKKGKPKLIVKRKFVKLGMRRNNSVAVLSGIKAGDEVVTSGQLKLQNNTHVVINNTVKIN